MKWKRGLCEYTADTFFRDGPLAYVRKVRWRVYKADVYGWDLGVTVFVEGVENGKHIVIGRAPSFAAVKQLAARTWRGLGHSERTA